MTSAWRAEPILGVRDVRLAVDFYTKVLGFHCENIFEPDGGDGAVYALLDRDGVGIHLQIRRREPLNRTEIERDVYFYVPDVDILYAEWKRCGAVCRLGPTDAPYGMRELVIEDRDGNLLAFGSENK